MQYRLKLHGFFIIYDKVFLCHREIHVNKKTTVGGPVSVRHQYPYKQKFTSLSVGFVFQKNVSKELGFQGFCSGQQVEVVWFLHST